MSGQAHQMGVCPRCNGPLKRSAVICSECKREKVQPAHNGPAYSMLKLRQSARTYDKRIVASVDALAAGMRASDLRLIHGGDVVDEALKIRAELEAAGSRRRYTVVREVPRMERPLVEPEYKPKPGDRDRLRADIQAAMRRGEIVP